MDFRELAALSERIFQVIARLIEERPEDRLTAGPSPKQFSARYVLDPKPRLELVPEPGRTTVRVDRGQAIQALRAAIRQAGSGGEVAAATFGGPPAGAYLLALWREMEPEYERQHGPLPWHSP